MAVVAGGGTGLAVVRAKHQEQDEFFYVIDGRLRIELEGRDPVELAPGMAFSVPRGMQHHPVALEPRMLPTPPARHQRRPARWAEA